MHKQQERRGWGGWAGVGWGGAAACPLMRTNTCVVVVIVVVVVRGQLADQQLRRGFFLKSAGFLIYPSVTARIFLVLGGFSAVTMETWANSIDLLCKTANFTHLVCLCSCVCLSFMSAGLTMITSLTYQSPSYIKINYTNY